MTKGSDPVLRRTVHVRRGEKEVQVVVEVGPVYEVEEGYWCCDYKCGDLYGDKPTHIAGEDGIQALQLCLRFLDLTFSGAAEDGVWEVWWNEPGDHGGFGVEKPS